MNDSIAGDVERIISGAGSAEADCAVITLGEALDAWRRADAWRDPVAYTQLVDRLARSHFRLNMTLVAARAHATASAAFLRPRRIGVDALSLEGIGSQALPERARLST
jgi:hypothetical protein